jgi:hypothetical protein
MNSSPANQGRLGLSAMPVLLV